MADVALGALLRFTSRKSDNPEASAVRPTLNWNKFETARDIAKLKKRVVHAVERVNKTTDIAEIESGKDFFAHFWVLNCLTETDGINLDVGQNHCIRNSLS